MQSQASEDRFRRRALQPEEALKAILGHVKPLVSETVGLLESWGRRLAEPLAAPHPFPPFRRSGMDGYAVIAADLAEASSASPVTLEVLEELPGGVAPRRAIRSGQASRIMTGGMVPEGADAVVMLEMTATSGAGDRSFVTIGKSVAAGLNLADIGSEIAEGAALIQPGCAIGPGESALLAACGSACVAVAKRPRVAVLSTGSELLEVEEALAPAKIRNSNAPMLAALLREAGALPELLGKVPDDKGEAESLIRESMERCDLVVTTGGVSVGDYDIMADLVAESGQLLFNKVAMRPGSPTSAALIGGKPLIALSGNPSACFVGFHLFVRPALLAMQSARSCLPGSFQAFISVPYPKTNAYRRYLRGYTELRDGRVWVTPTGKDQSSLMTTIAGADCLIEIPAAKHGVEAGQLLTAWRLGRGE